MKLAALPVYSRWFAAVLGVVASCGLLAGCNGGEAEATVRGKVTFQDKTVDSGLINFLAPGGRPLGGGLQSDGTYELQAPPGEYRVRIDAPPPVPESWKEGDPPPKLGPRLVPEKFASYETSGLTATVTGEGEQTIDFPLP